MSGCTHEPAGGREAIELSDRLIADIEEREATALGEAAYASFMRRLGTVVDSLTRTHRSR